MWDRDLGVLPGDVLKLESECQPGLLSSEGLTGARQSASKTTHSLTGKLALLAEGLISSALGLTA